jgi:hypothetical protein
MHDLSDEALCERWVENPYYQLFCGEEFFRHDLPFDRSSMTRWRQRMGEERLNALLQESLAVAIHTGADATFTGAIGAAGGYARHQASPILCQSWQDRADQTSEIRACQAVHASGESTTNAQDLSRPCHARHHA